MMEKIAELIDKNPNVDKDLLLKAQREMSELGGVVRAEMLTFRFNLPYSSPRLRQHGPNLASPLSPDEADED